MYPYDGILHRHITQIYSDTIDRDIQLETNR